MEFSDLFQYSRSGSAGFLEREVEKVLNELKEELAELKFEKGPNMRPFSSVNRPHDVEYYRNAKRLMIERTLKMSQAHPLVRQTDVLKEEMEIAEKPEFTLESLPYLLHQHFSDRIYQLVQCKYQHLQRWKIFSTNTQNMDDIYPEYNRRLKKIITEYKDCLSRASRLSAVRVNKHPNVITEIRMDDILIYLRAYIWHRNSTKKFYQFLKILQWMPVIHSSQFSSLYITEDGSHTGTEKPVNRLSNRYDDIKSGKKKEGGPTGTFSHILSSAAAKIKDQQQANKMSTQPLPSSAMAWALGFLGGGRCSNETTLEIPVHSLKFHDFKNQLKFLAHAYGVKCNVDQIKILSDEMTLYAETYKKFVTVFPEQEAAKVLVMNDAVTTTNKKPQLTKKPSNWIPFIKLKPKRNAFLEAEWAELYQEQQRDLLLEQQAQFLKISDPEKVIAILQNHTNILIDELSLDAINSMNEKCLQKTETLWKKIYSSSNVDTMKGGLEPEEYGELFDEEPSKLQQFQSDTYDYNTTIKMLGLDNANQNEADPSMTHGAFISLLLLRHLRIRDLQYSCLLSFNYLRSIERIITINDCGLSVKGDQLKETSPQNHRNLTELNGTLGGGGGLGSHGYIHSTPADSSVNETEFIEFSDMEYHDNCYEMKDGNIYVKDQNGLYILYDEAINDFHGLEENHLILGSYYIEKDKNLRRTFLTNRRDFLTSEDISNNFLNPEYISTHVDRFGILLDAWTQELSFQNCKRELIRHYYEAYCNVFDRDERRLLAQTITQIINQRPRFHPEYTQYFNNTYFNECILLHLHTSLVASILNQQIADQRNEIEKITEEMYGLPLPIIKKHPISVHFKQSALEAFYLLEFQPSLSLASRIPKAIDYVIEELSYQYCLYDSENIFVLERKVWEIAVKEWKSMKVAGLAFSEDVQKNLFSNCFVENANLMSDLTAKLMNQFEKGSRKNFQEKQRQMISKALNVFEIINLRYRLIDSAWETELLSELYKKQGQEFNYGEHHLNLRCVPFEFATMQTVKRIDPIFMTTILDDESSLDRYVPKNLQLAIHEYDTLQIGSFSFRAQDQILDLLNRDGLQKIQVVLKCQLCQRNALIFCVQQVYYCHLRVIQAEHRPHFKDKAMIQVESKVNRFLIRSKLLHSKGFHMREKHTEDYTTVISYNETFLSLQLEKLPLRDEMLNKFIQFKKESGNMSETEIEQCKRSLISKFCDEFHLHMSQYSIRNQIIFYYKSLGKILNHFPIIRKTYFEIGKYQKEYPLDSKNSKKRVLSVDGKTVCNIWYVPHCTEIVQLFRNLDEQSCIEALSHMLVICASLHDIVHYIFAHVTLGHKRVHLFTGQEGSDSSVISGGVEGVKREFNEIQAQVMSLTKPNCPILVGELLTIRRDITFLEFDLSVRHSVIETFLMSGNKTAYEALNNNMDISITLLSDAPINSVYNMNLKVPEPFEVSDEKSRQLFPWMTFIGRNGPFPSMFWPCYMIEYYIQLCMSSLKDVDRTIVSGEILGVSIAMEDMLLSEFPPIRDIRRETLVFSTVDTLSISEIARKVLNKRTDKLKQLHPNLVIEISTEDLTDEDADRKMDPIDIYALLQFCLLVWKQLEIVKQEWISLWQHVLSGNPVEDYQEICKLYRKEIMFPVLQSLAKKYGRADLYVGVSQINDPMIIPKGTTELEVKICQLKRILESIDYQMTRNILQKVQQDLALAVAERSREEFVLPIDLWRSSGFSENVKLSYPCEMLDFREKLFSKVIKSSPLTEGTMYTFTEEHLIQCLQQLACNIVRREKHSYESYCRHYEKLIKAYHNKLFYKEQEIYQVREEVKSMEESIMGTVECQMADKTFHLLMEITRLRHTVDELREKHKEKTTTIHNELREDYSKLVENFFIASSQLREKFDVFRHELKDDVMEKITVIRRQAVEEMEKVRLKHRITAKDENRLQNNLLRAEEVRQLQADNVQLNILLLKLRTINTWRQNFSQANYMKAINKLLKDMNKLKQENIRLTLLSNKENQLLKEQVIALRLELAKTVKGFSTIKSRLDAELRQKEEKLHRNRENLRYDQERNHIKQEHLDKLFEDLCHKERQLQLMYEPHDQEPPQYSESRNKNVVSSLKKFLEQERNMKLKAFQEVDRLRSMVDDLESSPPSRNRPHSVNWDYPPSPLSGNKTKSRTNSYYQCHTCDWSPQTGWEKKRALTADLKEARSSDKRKTIQRPKTVTGFLRSYFNNQLTTQEDIVKLSDLLNSNRK